MRPLHGAQGFTMVEFLIAGSLAALVGGVVLLLIAGMSQISTMQSALHELSGYLDATTEQVKRDVWQAQRACTGNCPPLGGSVWLALDLPDAGGNPDGWTVNDIQYTIDASTDPTDIRLIRTRTGEGARLLIHHLDPARTPAPGITGSLVTFTSIGATKTVLQRAYARLLSNVSYRCQAP